jgi:hypothetical protein
VDEQRVPAADVQQVETAGRGLQGDRECDCGREVHAVGQRRIRAGEGILGVRPGGRVGPADDPVTDGHTGDAVAEGAYDSGDLEAEHRGQRGREEVLRGAAADLAVERVDAGSAYSDADLAGSGNRLRHVGAVQHLGVAELVERDGSHNCLLRVG